MPSLIPAHCSWFEPTGQTIQTSDGKKVEIIRFNHQADDNILKEWAQYFRNHYCSESELTNLATITGVSRADYLRDVKFPSSSKPGPSIKSGDFSEILVADYIQFLLNFNVPRTRYDRKNNRDSSTLSTDILGFKFIGDLPNHNDELITCEVKGALSNGGNNTLQNAIDDSKKNFETRLPLALTAAFLRLSDRGDIQSVEAIKRFMNKSGLPYKDITCAALVCTSACWNDILVTEADGSHPNSNTLFLIITGEDLMKLANNLYETAYATA